MCDAFDLRARARVFFFFFFLYRRARAQAGQGLPAPFPIGRLGSSHPAGPSPFFCRRRAATGAGGKGAAAGGAAAGGEGEGRRPDASENTTAGAARAGEAVVRHRWGRGFLSWSGGMVCGRGRTGVRRGFLPGICRRRATCAAGSHQAALWLGATATQCTPQPAWTDTPLPGLLCVDWRRPVAEEGGMGESRGRGAAPLAPQAAGATRCCWGLRSDPTARWSARGTTTSRRVLESRPGRHAILFWIFPTLCAMHVSKVPK